MPKANEDSLRRSLVAAIARNHGASQTFATEGTLPAIEPELFVEDYGPVRFPLKPAEARKLATTGQVAPYGKGTRTLVDPTVRKTLEIDASRVRLGEAWNRAIADATRAAARRMGLPDDDLEPVLYKLLLYEKGGFFLPHRDSEKHDRMVASLIVVLPNPFEGGRLDVRHAGRTKSFDFSASSFKRKSDYAAFYADCEHEVKPVTHGLRVCLAYNLVLKATAPRPVPPPSAGDPLVGAIRDWVAAHPTNPLVFAFDHEYTSRGLARDLLKGTDRARTDLVAAAAEAAGCRVQLAQLDRHDVLSAYDGSEYGGRRWRETSDYEVVELIEREFSATTWAGLDGARLPWGAMALDPDAVVSSRPFDEWIPDREDYEGYTGNAGNTLDRWYERAGLVVWSRAHHYEILPQAGLDHALVELKSMVAGLRTAPESHRAAARSDALSLARGILAHWPIRWHHIFAPESQTGMATFPKLVLELDDPALAARFLQTVAEKDQVLPLESFAVEAGRRWGWTALAREWMAFLLPPTDPHRRNGDRLCPRDAAWLAALGEAGAAAEAPWLAEACRLAVDAFTRDRRPDYRERGTTSDERALPALLRALYAAGFDELATRAIAFARQNPKIVSRETGSVPALVELAPWCRARFGALPDAVRDWFAAERAALAQATAARPAPPTDWTRPNDFRCPCERCKQLKTFLADPALETIAIPTAEENRRHILQIIASEQLDAKGALSKVGRPYSLVLTKTNLAHGRAVTRYEADCRLLESLPDVEDGASAAVAKPPRKRAKK